MPQKEKPSPWNDSKQAALERAYIRDGRANPCHPMHGSYTGLKARHFAWNGVVAPLLPQNSLPGTIS